MPRFSANLTFLFSERPFLDRFSAAAEIGFRSVEFMFPYEHSVDELAERLRDHQLTLDLFNLPAGDFAGGERGVAAFPARSDEFRAGVESALEYARVLGTRKINCLVGLRDASMTWDQQYACLVGNLRWAADRVAESKCTLHVEQLNSKDTPGFFLDSLAVAETLLDDVGSPHLRLQFDAYHVQRANGDVVASLRRLIDRVGHVQIADSPDRHEPGTGELNYAFILNELDRLGYEGHVGLEYRPSSSTERSFEWITEYGWRP